MVLSLFDGVMRVVRNLFAGLDRSLFGIFGSLIKVYFGMAEMNLLNVDAIRALKSRIYIFVSIYMVFKISISLLQAMVNPEVANDKKTGLGTIISRIGVSIILLVAIPLAMDNILFGSTNGRSNQEIIASLVPKVILGSSTTAVANDADVQDNIGQHIASAAWNAFLPINSECGEGEESKLVNMKVSSIVNHVNDQCENNNQKYFKYDYSFGISTICGAIMCIMLIGYSLDIVARMLKLQILEVLAPIPILAYVDPGKGKDNLFSTWGKTLISTYLDFFIKLATLYFIIFAMSSFITNIGNIMPSSFSGLEKGYCTVIIIIGLLLALQQLPQFICSIFGIKPQGMGAGLGTLLGAAGGLASGGLAGMLSGGMAGATEGLAGKAGLSTINKGKDAGKKTIFGNENQRAIEKAAYKQEKQNEREKNKKNGLPASEREQNIWDSKSKKFVSNPNAGKPMSLAEKVAEAKGNYDGYAEIANDNHDAYEEILKGNFKGITLKDEMGNDVSDKFAIKDASGNITGFHEAAVKDFVERSDRRAADAKTNWEDWKGKAGKSAQEIGKQRFKARHK